MNYARLLQQADNACAVVIEHIDCEECHLT